MVRSGSERKKLYSRENGTISNGDVIELIPGHYFFKYVVSDCDQNVAFRGIDKSGLNDNGREACSEDDQALSRKRLRQSSEEKVSVKVSKVS